MPGLSYNHRQERTLTLQSWMECKVWKPATVVKHRHTEKKKDYRNKHRLRGCPAEGKGGMKTNLPSGGVVQDVEQPGNAESDRTTTKLPDVLARTNTHI